VHKIVMKVFSLSVVVIPPTFSTTSAASDVAIGS